MTDAPFEEGEVIRCINDDRSRDVGNHQWPKLGQEYICTGCKQTEGVWYVGVENVANGAKVWWCTRFESAGPCTRIEDIDMYQTNEP